jgi:hypothetical protein
MASGLRPVRPYSMRTDTWDRTRVKRAKWPPLLFERRKPPRLPEFFSAKSGAENGKLVALARTYAEEAREREIVAAGSPVCRLPRMRCSLVGMGRVGVVRDRRVEPYGFFLFRDLADDARLPCANSSP